jgi:hypothetical protein
LRTPHQSNSARPDLWKQSGGCGLRWSGSEGWAVNYDGQLRPSGRAASGGDATGGCLRHRCGCRVVCCGCPAAVPMTSPGDIPSWQCSAGVGDRPVLPIGRGHSWELVVKYRVDHAGGEEPRCRSRIGRASGARERNRERWRRPRIPPADSCQSSRWCRCTDAALRPSAPGEVRR